MIFVRVGLQSLLKLRTELYSYLQALPLKYHDARRSTDSSFRVAYDSQAIQSIYSKGSFIFSSVVTIVGTLAVMVRKDWELTLVALGIMPLVVLAIYVFAKRIRSQSTTIQERESDVLAVAQEGLSSIRMVHAFGREDYEVAQFRTRATHSLEANMRFTGTQMKSSLVIGTLMALGTAAMYYLGSIHVLDARLSIGDLWLFSTLPGHALPAARGIDLHDVGARGRRGGRATLLRGAGPGGRREGCAGGQGDHGHAGRARVR